MTTLPFSFNFLINYQIYQELSSKDRHSLSLTCKPIRRFILLAAYREKQASKIVELIFATYDIIYSSLPLKDLKQFFFHPVSLLELGENHTKNRDRLLNSRLIELCWHARSEIFIEGGKTSVAISKAYQSGQCLHLPKAISDKADTWDVDTLRYSFGSKYKNFVINVFKSVKDLLHLSFYAGTFSMNAYLTFIKRHFDTNQHKKIYNLFPLLTDYRKACMAYPSSAFLTSLEYHTIGILYEKFFEIRRQFGMELLQFCKYRDWRLLCTKYNALFTRQCCAVITAGIAHLNNRTMIQNTKILQLSYKKLHTGYYNAAPVLMLKPKDSNTIQSVNTCLSYIMETHQPDETETEVPYEMEQITQKILNADYKTFNFDQNHYGLWLNFCLSYLEYKIKLQEK